MNVINTTKLARQFGKTTQKVTQLLESAGVFPLEEITLPSGRAYKVWDEAQATHVLSKHARPKTEPNIAQLQKQLAALKRQVQAMCNAQHTH